MGRSEVWRLGTGLWPLGSWPHPSSWLGSWVVRDAGGVPCRGSFWSIPRLAQSVRGVPLPDRSPRAHLAPPEHGHGSVTGNWLSERPPASKNTFITIAVRDEGWQVGVWPGLAETGVPGTAVTLCPCSSQLRAPAANCHRTRHETHPWSGAARRAEPEAALVISCVTRGPSAGT